MLEYFRFSERISRAVQYGEPIVLIESTVWLHGLPESVAMQTLGECNRIIEEEGAHPAVVVLAEGKILVGVSVEDLKEIKTTDKCVKVNVRDIPSVLQKRQAGSITVSALVFIADLLNIPVCLTGGTGGVHHMAENTFDISADLHALAQYPVILVSSGIKSVLNVEATLEKLETLGIPVLTYKTDFFPTFYSNSMISSPAKVDSIEDIVEIYRAGKRLKLNKALLVANPIPESEALPQTFIDEITEKTLLEAQNLQIKGKDITPFILERLHQHTMGETVKANISLLKENAKLAAQLSKYVFYE
jgi:pseudouridylate synthase